MIRSIELTRRIHIENRLEVSLLSLLKIIALLILVAPVLYFSVVVLAYAYMIFLL